MSLPLHQHIASMSLLPELQDQLQQAIYHDLSNDSYQHPWLTVLQRTQLLLGAELAATSSFLAAWRLMYHAICHLDHLQDGDPIENSVFQQLSPAQQYGLVFGYYTLATCELARVEDSVNAGRIVRVQRFWSESMLRMASGQFRDLLMTNPVTVIERSPHTYQELAQAKTGATFALAFGGAAMLHTDDQAIITALQHLGELYGTLLQYSDDLLDAEDQPNATLTLPNIFDQTHFQMAQPEKRHAFWQFVYKTYYTQATSTAQQLPPALRTLLLELFDTTFLPTSELEQSNAF
jgi:Polyprenyl synthetase